MTRRVTLSVVSLLLLFTGTANAQGPLRVHPDNPRYFAGPDGRAVWLTGSHTWATFQERGLEGQTPDFDFPRYLDFLEQHGHNFVRLWVWEHAQWMQFTNAPVRYKPLAYQRTGPGLALDGRPKFDLTKFNEEFFERLGQRVELARERGFYVGVMFFQGFSVRKGGKPGVGNNWHGNPFNKANNINGIDGDPSGNDTGHETHTLKVPAITRFQEVYVRKVVDTLNGLDNVLWEIGNELHDSSVQWQYHMIRFVRDCEKGRAKQHLIGMTGAPINTPDLMASPADWISPPGAKWMDNPPAADGSKIVLVDTDHCRAMFHDPAWVWKNFTRGNHFVLMDGYMDFRIGSPKQPNQDWDVTRQAMGDTLRFASRMKLAEILPTNDAALCSTRYCLRNPGKEYLVYQPETGPFDVNVVAGTYHFEWFDPSSHKTVETSQRHLTGGSMRFTPPFEGTAVLYLKAIAEGAR